MFRKFKFLLSLVILAGLLSLIRLARLTNVSAGISSPISTPISVPITPTPTPTPTPLPQYFFRGEYFNNRKLVGASLLKNDIFNKSGVLSFNWGAGSPDFSINSDKFSARWTAQQNFEQGDYIFGFRHDDGLKVYLDGKLIYSRWNKAGTGQVLIKNISSGLHNLKIEYNENKGFAALEVTWNPVP